MEKREKERDIKPERDRLSWMRRRGKRNRERERLISGKRKIKRAGVIKSKKEVDFKPEEREREKRR